MGDQINFSTGIEKHGKEQSYAWDLDLNHPISDHLSADIGYYNQGHFEGHHRDGAGVSLWASTQVGDPHLTVSAGAGPWAYADTVIPDGGKPAHDVHGIGAMAGVGAAWHADNHMVYQVRANYFAARNSFNTYSITGSIGYDFGGGSGSSSSDSSFDPSPGSSSGKNEISVLSGKTIVNIPGDVPSVATSLEYRRHIGDNVDVSVAAISEGNNNLSKRVGVAPELWLRKDFLDDRLSLSAGAGVYAGIDKKKPLETGGSSDRFTAGIASISAAYKLTDHLKARITWHRPITNYNRDSDVVLAGIGYQF